MAPRATLKVLISLFILSVASPASANPENQSTGNSSQALWMDLARGYGWVTSRLGFQPRKSRNGKVRTGLASFRNTMQQPAKPERLKLTRPSSRSSKKSTPAKKPASKKKTTGFKPLDPASLKAPPGNRPYRRLPTRVRSR